MSNVKEYKNELNDNSNFTWVFVSSQFPSLNHRLTSLTTETWSKVTGGESRASLFELVYGLNMAKMLKYSSDVAFEEVGI